MNKALVLISILLTSHAYGAEVEKLSLSQAIDIVKTNNIELKNMDLNIQISDKDTSIATGNHFGKLDLEQQYLKTNAPENVFGFKMSAGTVTFGDFGFGEFMAAQMDPTMTPEKLLAIEPQAVNNPEPETLSRTSIKYQVPLYAGGMISNYQKITEKVKEIRKLQKKDLESEKIFEIQKSFYSYKLLDDMEEKLNQISKNIKNLKETVKEMQNIGYAKKVDLLEVNAREANIQNLLIDIEKNKKLLLHFISFLTQENVKSIVTPGELKKEYNNVDLGDIHKIKMAKLGTSIQDDFVSIGYAEFLPKIGGFAEVSSSNEKLLQDLDNTKYTFGVVMTMNIFNGDIDRKNLEKKQLELLKSKNNEILAKEGINLQINQLNTEINSLSLKEDTQFQQVKLLNEIEENYMSRYKEQLVSINDVLIQNSTLIQNIMKLNQIKASKDIKILELNKITNKETL